MEGERRNQLEGKRERECMDEKKKRKIKNE